MANTKQTGPKAATAASKLLELSKQGKFWLQREGCEPDEDVHDLVMTVAGSDLVQSKGKPKTEKPRKSAIGKKAKQALMRRKTAKRSRR